MYCKMPEQEQEITLFTLVETQVVSADGSVSEPVSVRLGQLPKLIDQTFNQGKMLLMTADGYDQADILDFLEKSEKVND